MMLPEPPNDFEKYLYVDQNKIFLYSFSIISTLLLTTGGVLFSLGHPSVIWYLAFVIVTFFYLMIGFAVGMFSKPFQIEDHYKATKDLEYLPSVDVFVPTCGEDLSVIENTLSYVSNLDYPNFTVYVLDDSDRKAVKVIADKYKFFYLVRKDRPHLKKSGNVREAFKMTHGELILILDTDFCPRSDFLKETVGYFRQDDLAILQTPQFFRVHNKQNWVEKGAASVQELFYRLIQVNRNHFGASICVGTCALYRREALKPLGGTYPITDSEDTNTGLWCFKKGWKIKYVPINLAAGLCPDTIDAFFTQNYRWCRGASSLFFSKKRFWSTKMTIMQRLSFLSGMLYYQSTALGLLLTQVPSVIMVWWFPDDIYWYNLVFSLPSLVFGIIHLKLWSKQEYGLHVLKVRAVSYYSHLFALFDIFKGSAMPWVPTGDAKLAKANTRVIWFKRLMLIYSLVMPVTILTGVAIQAKDIFDYRFYPQVLISLFYAWINLSCLIDLGEVSKRAKNLLFKPSKAI